MRERIDKIGGRLRVKTRRGTGTEISVTWRYEEPVPGKGGD
jgi:signal transduction histidine kinase